MSHLIAFSFLLHKFSSSNIYISIQPATFTKQHYKTDISKQIKSQYICHGRCKVIIEINSSSVNRIQFCRFYHRNILANFYIIYKCVINMLLLTVSVSLSQSLIFTPSKNYFTKYLTKTSQQNGFTYCFSSNPHIYCYMYNACCPLLLRDNVNKVLLLSMN